MELKQGYKQTALGVIPKDWEVVKFKNLAPLQRGFDLPNRELKKGQFPVVYSNGIVNYHKKYQVKSPGVVTGRSGTIGKVTFVVEHFWPHNTTLWVTDFKSNFPKYVYYLYLNLKLEKFATGSGVPTLNRNDVHEQEIPLPPLPEQKAIAQVLSDTDSLIKALTEKLAKKRALKQGAMQRLLTPNEDWEVRKLGEVCDFLDNLRRPIKSSDRNNMEGNYPYYGASGIIDYVNDYIFDDELILLGEDGENILSRNLPLAFKAKGKFWVNNHAHVLKPKFGHNLDFLVELLESKDYALLNSGTAQPKLNKQSCYNINLCLPSLEEQTRIATILSDMDAEIAQLEEKLAKYKLLKQGLMQELLTGKIRLNLDGMD